MLTGEASQDSALLAVKERNRPVGELLKFWVHGCLIQACSCLVEHCFTEEPKMQRTSFNYSTKNIPVAPAKVYTKRLIEKTEQFLSRMIWKAFHYWNPVTAAEKETFGFKTRNCPPVVEEMKSFEEGMIYIIQKVSFKGTQSQFQEGRARN